jgi:hypothetical protein
MRVRSATALDAEEGTSLSAAPSRTLRYGPWRRPVSDRSLDRKQDICVEDQVAGDPASTIATYLLGLPVERRGDILLNYVHPYLASASDVCFRSAPDGLDD